MTKRRDLIKLIADAAAEAGIPFGVHREGGRHTVYDLGGKRIPIARHADIADQMAEVIFKQAAEKLGKGWWKA